MYLKNLFTKLSTAILGKLPISSKPFTIIIEGNIGSGKTSFLQHFRNFDSICILDEPVDLWRDCEGHNLLGLMYEDPEKWCFSLQSYIQLTMASQHLLKTDKPIKVMERSLFSARYCFVEKMLRDKNMPAPSGAVIHEWFKWITQNTDINVDLIVYLRTSPEVVYDRILNRDRREEKAMPFQYIKDLHAIHESWLVHRTHGYLPAPVLTLDANVDKTLIANEFKKYNYMFHKIGV